MTMGGADAKPGPAFYSSLLGSPFVDELTLDFARAAIAGEQLGQDDVPDILSVSLSGHDYVNHACSAESRLSHDHLLQLDRMLQEFFADLDATVGKDNYLAVLTADHGFMPAPEVSRARGLDAGRINGGEILARLNAELEKRFATPKLALYVSASALVLDKKLIAQKGLAFDTVAGAARDFLLAEPGFAAAYTRTEITSRSRAGAPFFDAVLKSLERRPVGRHPGRAEAELDVRVEHGEHHARVAVSLRHERADPVLRPGVDARRAPRPARRGRRHRADAVGPARRGRAGGFGGQAAAARRALNGARPPSLPRPGRARRPIGRTPRPCPSA